MKKLKKYLPSTKKLENSKELKGLKPYIESASLWSYDCQIVARGVAAGLAGAVIPGFQFFYAALLAILLRGNLPIALGCTFVTNPFTVIPVTYFVYYVGSLVIGNGNGSFTFQKFHWDFSSFHAFWSNVSVWLLQFGKAFLVGVPIVSVGIGILGYLGTLLIWQGSNLLFHKKKK